MGNRPSGVPAATDDFDFLYRKYAPQVRMLATRRLPGKGLADDVVQETFLRAYRSLDKLECDRPPWPWLRAIADNVCTDMLRRLSRRTEESASEADLETQGSEREQPWGDDQPAEVFFAGQRQVGVRDALRAVHPRQRRALLLAAQGIPRDEVAVLEGTTIDAVKATLQRGRQTFRTRYLAIAAERGLLGLAALVFGRSVLRARIEAARAQRLASRVTPLGAEVALPTSLVSAVVCMSMLGGVLGSPPAEGAEAARAERTAGAVVDPDSARGHPEHGFTRFAPKVDAPAPPAVTPARASPPVVRRDVSVADAVAGSAELKNDTRRVGLRAETDRFPPDREPATTEVWVEFSCRGDVRAAMCNTLDEVAD